MVVRAVFGRTPDLRRGTPCVLLATVGNPLLCVEGE